MDWPLKWPLDEVQQARIRAFLRFPSFITWEVASTALVGHSGLCGCVPSCRMLWQAVCAVDPSFPRTNPSTWKRIPDPFTVVRAAQHASGIDRYAKVVRVWPTKVIPFKVRCTTDDHGI